MLTIGDTTRHIGRRDFLRVGSLGLGGLALPNLLPAATSPPHLRHLVKDRSVIFLFMHGGPSQTETFDPKMTAPAGVRSATGEVQTAIPGITFGGTFPKIAALANKVNIVRSFATGDGQHDVKPLVHRHTFGANLGSLYARVAGNSHPQTGLPTNTLLFPQVIDTTTQSNTAGCFNKNFEMYSYTGLLGASYRPFMPGTGGHLQQDMKLNLPMHRLTDRRTLLSQLDRLQAAADQTGADALTATRNTAFNTILKGVGKAFDLSLEDPKTIERYDTAPLVRPASIGHNRKNHRNFADNAKTLGKLLLLARRLCEHGCGFVTVTTKFVWDMHADDFNCSMTEGMGYMAPPFDHAVSTFIHDLEARSLSDKILLVCCGEMGRTPKLNDRGGRDHWGNITPLLIYGGGLQSGQVIGQSTRDAGEPATERYDIRNLVATIMHALLDIGELRIAQGLPADLTRTMTGWKPISGLTKNG